MANISQLTHRRLLDVGGPNLDGLQAADDGVAHE